MKIPSGLSLSAIGVVTNVLGYPNQIGNGLAVTDTPDEARKLIFKPTLVSSSPFIAPRLLTFGTSRSGVGHPGAIESIQVLRAICWCELLPDRRCRLSRILQE